MDESFSRSWSRISRRQKLGGCFAQSAKMQLRENDGVTERDAVVYCDTVDCAVS